MRFGQTGVLKTAKGKIGVGLALLLFGAVAVLAAPNVSDRLICSVIVLAGVAFVIFGFRQDREEKRTLRHEKKEAKR